MRSPPELRVDAVAREFELDIRDAGEPPNEECLDSGESCDDDDGLLPRWWCISPPHNDAGDGWLGDEEDLFGDRYFS